MTSLAALRQSLYWQEHVARSTHDPVQRARCLKAAARLAEQIKEKEAQA